MDDLLHRLFRLTLSHKKHSIEDFVSLCLGHQLERDLPLLDHLVDQMLGHLEGEERAALVGWRACPTRGVEVRAQVLARTPDESRPGWADLVLGLSGSDTPARVVIEAKVGSGCPDEVQLDRYRRAFRRATVVGLVERRVVRSVPGPAISWDDVLTGLQNTEAAPAALAGRDDLRSLLLSAQVGDPRLALGADAWETALRFEDTFARVDHRLKQCLVQMGPTPEVRAEIERRLASEEVEPEVGWGSGFASTKAIRGTRVRGLTLGLRASSFADELVWQLEVKVAGKRLPRWMAEPESEWWPVRGLDGWFVTELTRPRGTGILTKRQFRELIVAGRGALRRLHTHTRKGKWAADGAGEPPRGPRLSIPELRAGLVVWEPVRAAIEHTLRDTLDLVCASSGHQGPTKPFRAHEGGWRTTRGVLPSNVVMRGERTQGVERLEFEVFGAPVDAGARVAAALESWSLPSAPPELVDDRRLVVRLSAQSFASQGLAPELARVLVAALPDT